MRKSRPFVLNGAQAVGMNSVMLGVGTLVKYAKMIFYAIVQLYFNYLVLAKLANKGRKTFLLNLRSLGDIGKSLPHKSLKTY